MYGEWVLQKIRDWRVTCGKDEVERSSRWKPGHSCFELAHSWHYAVRYRKSISQEQCVFPAEVSRVFDQSKSTILHNLVFDLAYSDAQVEDEVNTPVPFSDDLPANTRNDLSVYAINPKRAERVVVAVEGKAHENFGETVSNKISIATRKHNTEWILERLNALKRNLNLDELPGHIRYQFLLRSYAAIELSKKHNISNAVMLVHSFSETNEHFDDYKSFSKLLKLSAIPDRVVGPIEIQGINLHLAWVKGRNVKCPRSPVEGLPIPEPCEFCAKRQY